MQSPTSIWLSKTTIARDVVLAYLNHSTKFEIYADASESQLGSIITQNRLLAFFGRKKLSATKKRSIITKTKTLAIVVIIKEFKGMLQDQSIVGYNSRDNNLI